MMYLLDTNIWLELLLDREHAHEVKDFLLSVPSEMLCITDFSLHSIGVILGRLGSIPVFCDFISDLVINGSVFIIALKPSQMNSLVEAMEMYHLDFDDAYQYTASLESNLRLVSFDRDFNRTPCGRCTPADISRDHSSLSE